MMAAKSLCVDISRNLFESEILAASKFRPRLLKLRRDRDAMLLKLLFNVSRFG
jgi:hypothetical protein